MNAIPVLAFLPMEFAPLLICAAGFCMVVGARALAGALFMLGIALPLAPVILEPLLTMLPTPVLYGLLVFAAIALPITLLTLLIGKSGVDQMLGTLAADTVKALLRLPFRLTSGLCRFLFRLIF